MKSERIKKDEGDLLDFCAASIPRSVGVGAFDDLKETKGIFLNFAKHKCRLHRGCFAKSRLRCPK